MTTAEQIKILTKEFRPTSQKINIFDPNIQDTSTKFFKINDKEGNTFKLFAFSDRIKIETPLKTLLLFAINLPDIVCLANKILSNGSDTNKVYTDQSNDNSVLNCIKLIEQDLQDLGLETNEGLFIYRNVIQLTINKTRQLIPEISTLLKIKSKIEHRFPENPETVDVSKIPADLHDLIPILVEWAISDDLERDEKIKQSSKAKLKKVIDIVNPKINLINNYLNNFKDEPLPYEAILIGNLAELVSELTLIK